MGLLQRLLTIDRRIIYLLITLGVLVPLFFPIGFPVTITRPVRSSFEKIESLPEGSVVVVSFDYGPSTAPENDPQADAILRHCFARRLRVVAMALYSLGGLSVAVEEINRVSAEFPITYGVDYVNLGYKDGAQAALRRMNQDLHALFPRDAAGRPVSELPLMREVRSLKDVDLVVSIATGIIGEWWINLVNAQFGTKVIVGSTAIGTPKYYAYLRAGQAEGLLGGLKGASEYEYLLSQRYAEVDETYRSPALYSATQAMDIQTVVHLIMIALVVLGNVLYFASRIAARRTTGGRHA
jgi:hypothetical protein